MLNWVKKYFSDYETAMFYIMVIFYTIVMVLGTVYPYARLPWVRSYKTTPTTTEQTPNKAHDNNKT